MDRAVRQSGVSENLDSEAEGGLANNPAILLLITGGMIGLTFPIGKLAGQAGVPPIDWAFLIALSATVILMPFAFARRGSISMTSQFLRYCVISGAISYVIPNMLLFAALPKLGAGLTGLFYTLSPIVTLALSLIARLQPPRLLGLAGIAVGFAGALLLTWSRGDPAQPAAIAWIGVASLIPVSLAAGNVYRTIDWPRGFDPLVLAVGSNFAAAIIVFALSVMLNGAMPVHHFGAVPVLTAVQALSSAFLFLVFFRLQLVGGPVYLSQIGYVAAAVGLFSGIAFLGERYAAATWTGAAIIAGGVALSIAAQMRMNGKT
jgi:drug/metabolite transporter (DMT)-like permease